MLITASRTKIKSTWFQISHLLFSLEPDNSSSPFCLSTSNPSYTLFPTNLPKTSVWSWHLPAQTPSVALNYLPNTAKAPLVSSWYDPSLILSFIPIPLYFSNPSVWLNYPINSPIRRHGSFPSPHFSLCHPLSKKILPSHLSSPRESATSKTLWVKTCVRIHTHVHTYIFNNSWENDIKLLCKVHVIVTWHWFHILSVKLKKMWLFKNK